MPWFRYGSIKISLLSVQHTFTIRVVSPRGDLHNQNDGIDWGHERRRCDAKMYHFGGYLMIFGGYSFSDVGENKFQHETIHQSIILFNLQSETWSRKFATGWNIPSKDMGTFVFAKNLPNWAKTVHQTELFARTQILTSRTKILEFRYSWIHYIQHTLYLWPNVIYGCCLHSFWLYRLIGSTIEKNDRNGDAGSNKRRWATDSLLRWRSNHS